MVSFPLFSLCAALLCLEGKLVLGSLEGEFCSDVSYYDVISYSRSRAKCCQSDSAQVQCQPREEEVCIDVTEMLCEVTGYPECEIGVWPIQTKKCSPSIKNYPFKDCSDVEFKQAHTKQVPVCKDVTKNNCVSDWEIDANGNKVFSGLEDCTPVTWEECTIEEKVVDFPAVKTECGVVSQIKYLDFVEYETEATKLTYNCKPKSAVSCRPVTRRDCVLVSFSDCSMGSGDGSCRAEDVYTPHQEKIHQKKCLE